MKKITAILIIFAMFLAISQTAEAKVDWRDKLKRGLTNVVTSPLEIPKEIKNHWKQSPNKPIEKTAWLFGGVAKGLGMTLVRMGAGLWDTLTFNLEIPAGYAPVIEPEFVWSESSE